jgi:asparagine synthase (glutamine-hydrolysing)
MCGICGVIDFDKKINDHILEGMLDSIKHRGPDDFGFLIEDNFVAGIRRLSIIDISGGHQPIYNEDKSIVTFFNGEIYNYIELRQELKQLGHTFSTNSDTEVIVHLYEQYGISFINQLNGMFGIFLADLRNNEFYLIRDHFGIKPLYYSINNSTLVFASELKAILKSGLVNKSISAEAVVNYFNYLYIPSPKTAFYEIHKLDAGTYLKKSRKGIEKIRWYNVSDFCEPTSKKYNELKDEIRYLLEDSVKLQMRSDVPVGAYLSGGIDSSLLTAIASKNTELPINTFSVGFTPTEFDELTYARQVSQLFKTNHHELIVTAEDAIKQLPQLMWYMDEPIGDSAVLPSYLVSKLAVSHVKVALSGLGGDELFGGYTRYRPLRSKVERLWFLPKPVLKALRPVFSAVQPSYGLQIERLIDPESAANKYHKKVHQMSWEMIGKLTGKLNNQSWFGSDILASYNMYPGTDEINQRMFTDIQTYMNHQLLHLTDRMSMAVSLEARVPLLDHRLVELALSIPSHFKISETDTKIILKSAIKDILPDSILNRPKWGFAAPYKTWTLTNAMQELITQTMEGTLVSDGILDKRGVIEFLGNKEMIKLYSTWVWPVVALEVWYANYKNI